MVEVYLLYFLIIALWCKMCRKCLCFCHLKHWRVCICIVSLESLCLVILLFAMHTCVTKVSWHRHIAFYSMATFTNNVKFFPMPTLLFKEVFKGERCERIQLSLWWPFTVCKCSDGSYNVKLILFDQFQSLTVDGNATLRSLLFESNRQLLRSVTGNQTSA